MNHPRAQLRDLCDIQSGGTPRRTNPAFFGGTIPWVRIADLDTTDGVVLRTGMTLTEEGLAAINGRLFPSGTLLLSMYGTIGKVAIAGVPLSTNQAILGIGVRDTTRLDLHFLRHWFQFSQPYLESLGKGGTQQNVSAGVVGDLKIPLPPLAEQRRIAGVLDRVERTALRHRAAIAELGRLGRRLSHDAFHLG